MSGPLAGLKVIEMAAIGPVPLAGQLLADLGADVAVIDRKSGRPDPTDINRRNKRSIALDLKSDAGRKALLKLLETADILIEGFRPGVMEKLGLGPADCPDHLVYGRMTGWGQDGPLAQTAGHDINYLAITGVLHAIGPRDHPVPPLNMVADYGGGSMFLLLGVLSALYERQSSGKGQVVDAAMVDGVPVLASLVHTMLARQQWSTNRTDNLLDGGAPFYRCYETADGKHMSVGPIEPQFFATMSDILGVELPQYDRTQWPIHHERLRELFASRTRDEWTTAFDGTDACVAPVLDWAAAPDHPHNVARGTFIAPDGITQAAPAPRFSRTPSPAPTGPATAGADTDAILREAGYRAGEIAALRNEGTLT